MFKRIKKKFLDRVVVPKSDDFCDTFGSIDFSDSIDSICKKSNKRLFLNRYSPEQLKYIMERVGLFAHLRGLGFDNFILNIDTDESYVHYLKLYSGHANPESLLIDLRLSETKFTPDPVFFENIDEAVSFDMIQIEWLSAQNPKKNFSGDKPQLPGQKKPGLGVLSFCFDMMYVFARDVTKDGFIDIPDHAHGAIMYSRKFRFFNPRHEGILRAILRDLKKYSLNDISWGIITGTIVDTYKNSSFKYVPSEQLFCVSERLTKYFDSAKYRKIFKKYYRIKKYSFDYEKMVKMRETILKTKKPDDL